MRRRLLLLVMVSLLASCAGDQAVPEATSSTSTMSPATATTEAPATIVTPAATTTTPAPEIDVEIGDGEVTGPDRFEYATGDTVRIRVVADTAYELHVHGYDLRFQLTEEVPLILEFVADVPGIFEVETHPGYLVVFEIEVGG